VAEKAEKQQQASADAAVSDLGSCVSLSLATDERSEVASEPSVTTSSVAGPELSPGKQARRRPVSADLGPAGRRDRAVRSRSARGSPPPPPRQVPRDRSLRRSPSPAAKRPPEQRRVASSMQRKPPVPTRPSSGRASPRLAREAPSPVASPPPPSLP